MPTTDLESRTATLEESVRGLAAQLAVNDQATSQLRDALAHVGRPDWQVIMAGGILFMAILSAALIPNYMLAQHAMERAEEAILWQHDYQRGVIPSQTEPKLAAFEATFAKIDGQLATMTAQATTENRIMRTRTAFNLRHIEALRTDVDQLQRDIAWMKGKENRP